MVIPIMGYVAAASSFLPVAVGVMRYKKLGRTMRLFTLYNIAASLNVTMQYVLGLFKIKNYFPSDIFRLVEVPLIAIIYYNSISSEPTRKILKCCSALYVLIWLIDEIYFADPNRLNNPLAILSRIFLVLMSIVTLNAVLKLTSATLTREPMFWVLTGIVIYCTGTIVVLGLSNELLGLGLRYFVIGWHINWILFIASMLMFTKALVCSSQA